MIPNGININHRQSHWRIEETPTYWTPNRGSKSLLFLSTGYTRRDEYFVLRA